MDLWTIFHKRKNMDLLNIFRKREDMDLWTYLVHYAEVSIIIFLNLLPKQNTAYNLI